jgi:NAD(P)-dependent dehydrogenase (short-subunit alcohol dehydrogenase family)
MRVSTSAHVALITGAAQGQGRAKGSGLMGQGLCIVTVDRGLAGTAAPIAWRDMAVPPISPTFKEVFE